MRFRNAKHLPLLDPVKTNKKKKQQPYLVGENDTSTQKKGATRINWEIIN